MKKTWNVIRSKFALLTLLMLATFSSFAQDGSGSVYDVKQFSKHHVELYSGFLPYVVFGVVLVILGYVSYRYWRDNQEDDGASHEPHHQ
jgi:hypothetical protein